VISYITFPSTFFLPFLFHPVFLACSLGSFVLITIIVRFLFILFLPILIFYLFLLSSLNSSFVLNFPFSFPRSGAPRFHTLRTPVHYTIMFVAILQVRNQCKSDHFNFARSFLMKHIYLLFYKSDWNEIKCK
jgi:hypothetical protein